MNAKKNWSIVRLNNRAKSYSSYLYHSSYYYYYYSPTLTNIKFIHTFLGTRSYQTGHVKVDQGQLWKWKNKCNRTVGRPYSTRFHLLWYRRTRGLDSFPLQQHEFISVWTRHQRPSTGTRHISHSHIMLSTGFIGMYGKGRSYRPHRTVKHDPWP